ncbi:MAG: TrmH family RNA methyltransferase [Atopobiaceae bacterium]|nr:TrmH family RNA methyltransferase [Atopobiaceae bacterium]
MQLKRLAKHSLKSLGSAIVKLSDLFGEQVHYRRRGPTSFAFGATLVYDLLHFHPEIIMRIDAYENKYPEHYHDEVIRLAREKGVPVVHKQGRMITDGQQRVFSICAEFVKWKDEMLPGSHVVLVNPSNPSNVGAIIRSALAFGIHDVAIIKEDFDTFSPATIRVSMGTRLGMRVETFSTFDEYRERFPDNAIYTFMLDGAKSLSEVEKRAPFTLVFGNETTGLPAEFATYGQAVFIEQGNEVDSLNVSVSAAIGVYAFTRACAAVEGADISGAGIS